MSTQHYTEKEQEIPSQAPASLHTQETAQEEKIALAQVFPQPPQRPPRPRANRWVVIGAVILALVLISSLSIIFIPGLIQHPGGQMKPTPSPTAPVTPTPGTEITPTPEPGVVLGPQACPAGIGDPAHWNAIIGTNNGERSVESVSCANIMDNPSLQALVNVRHNNAQATLDVYVFHNITSSKPTRIFLLQGLVKGDARISGYNTVMTAEVDANSTLNAGKSVSAMKADLFREFDWSAEEGTLVQTAFPGIFPDLTRYQAEADQARVNQGQDTWKFDPQAVAKGVATTFFDWQRAINTTLLSGGGSSDVYATVLVQEEHLAGAQSQGPYVYVTLSRLEGNTHNIWVAIAVEDGTMLTLSNIDARSLITSPVTLQGTGAAFEAVIGRAVIYDHLYNDVGNAQITGDTGMGKANYTTKLVYDTTFRAGPQEGIVAVYQANGGISNEIYTAVMRKVMLNPPGVTLGELPCPIAVSNPSYWTPFVSAPPDIRVADSVSCGNLVGKPSLQAMVVATEILGRGPVYRSVFVFDNIKASNPKLLFKAVHLLQGDAKISGYSTIMTAQVDANFPLSSADLPLSKKGNIYREFQWSDGAGTFLQVAFPGIFPDLTRYQAENDQALVNKGQDTWKNDPQAVAKALAKQFFGWDRTLTTKVLSGGGSQDVDATVQVQEAPVQGARQGPTAIVTLSRLEGNTHNMWVAISVQDGNSLTLTTIQPQSLLSSPVKLEGKGDAFENTIGMAYILDHQYTRVGQALVMGSTSEGFGNVPYSVQVSYETTFKQGPQEGLVEILRNTPIEAAPYSAVMVKVLLDPQPHIALGPVSCPLVTQLPGYWEAVLGIDTSTGGVATVSCANLKGDPSLQAFLPVYYTNGQPGAYYVYDDITSAHPVQLLKMQTVGATISGANTILTQDVDVNSKDLYREFQWSAKTGAFVQVVFPGFYPDLTRWQAENDQLAVNQGKDSWKLDAVETTKHFAAALLRTPADSEVKLISGGGARDVNAVVTVTPPVVPGGGGPFPPVKVTLSRLEGNTNGGIWIVVGVESAQKTITTPKIGTLVSSPVTVTGSGSQFESQVGIVHILDHLYTDIGHAIAQGSAGFGTGPFSVDVPYVASFHGGAQEGIVVLYDENGGSLSLRGGVAMVKVLING